MLLAELVRHINKSPLRFQFSLVALDCRSELAFLRLKFDHVFISLGLSNVDAASELFFSSLCSINSRLSIFILTLKFCDLCTLFLASLECLFALGFEFLL